MIKPDDIKDVTEAIIEGLEPISVVVFGSVAKRGSGNDLDLLIIVADEFKNLRELDVQANKYLKRYTTFLSKIAGPLEADSTCWKRRQATFCLMMVIN